MAGDSAMVEARDSELSDSFNLPRAARRRALTVSESDATLLLFLATLPRAIRSGRRHFDGPIRSLDDALIGKRGE